MKTLSLRLTTAALLVACAVSGVGCYPASYYRPASIQDPGAVVYQDSKGYAMPEEPAPQPQPRYAGVDPGLVVAGAVAAGLLGYAIGSQNNYYHGGYYGPGRFCRGFYGPRYCR